jgi:hypothetical protein
LLHCSLFKISVLLSTTCSWNFGFYLVRAGVLAARYYFTVLFTARFRPLVISYLALLALCVCCSVCFAALIFLRSRSAFVLENRIFSVEFFFICAALCLRHSSPVGFCRVRRCVRYFYRRLLRVPFSCLAWISPAVPFPFGPPTFVSAQVNSVPRCFCSVISVGLDSRFPVASFSSFLILTLPACPASPLI